MGFAHQTIQDSRWRTIVKTDITGTNATPEAMVDVSSLLGYSAASPVNSLVNFVSVSWSVTSGVVLAWDATTDVTIIQFAGNGRYGGSDGFPAFTNNAAAANLTGDVVISNAAACKGYVVLVVHKIYTPPGSGIGWTG